MFRLAFLLRDKTFVNICSVRSGSFPPVQWKTHSVVETTLQNKMFCIFMYLVVGYFIYLIDTHENCKQTALCRRAGKMTL